MPKTVFDDDAAPWPDQATPGLEENPRAVIGGNEPPPEERIKVEFRQGLIEENANFDANLDRWIGAADRAVPADDKSLALCGDVKKALRTIELLVERTHKKVKQPYLDGGRVVDLEKRNLDTKIATAMRGLQNRMDAFVAKRAADEKAARLQREAEERRLAREAAEALAAARKAEEEAEAARAAATAPQTDRWAQDDAALIAAAAEERARAAAEAVSTMPVAPAAPAPSGLVRSDAGASVGSRVVWNSEVTDFALAAAAVGDDPAVQDAVSKAVARRVRAGVRKIDGCRIWETAAAVTR